MKTNTSLRRTMIACGLLLAISYSATAATFTWTQDSAATQDWTDSANWSGASVDSGPGTNTDTLTFFSDTTTALSDGNNDITTNVPDLTMNILTLNGKGAAATGSTNITIGTSANTWILDGTTPAVNLSGVLGTQALNYTVVPNLTLTQATTAFAGAGTGNFTFSGSISESASGMAISKAGASVLTLSNSNSYSGSTTITAGVLRLDHATALPGGIGTTGGNSALIFNGGVLGLGAGDFTRSLGTSGTANAVNFTGAGGWAAYGADRVVNLGGAADIVVWATANTGFNAKGLTLSATTATHMVDLQNPLNLGSATRTVTVNNGAATIDAKLSGNITGTAGLTKAGAGALWISGDISNSAGGFTMGGSGAVKLTGTNTYSGVTTNGFSNPVHAGLYFLGMQALSSNTSITETHNGGVGGHGTIYFLDDSATPASRSTVNLTHNQKNASQNVMPVFVGNNGSANGGNGSGGTTGSTIQLGNMNFNQTATGATNGTGLAVNGANDYGLELANVNVTLMAAYAANWNVKLNASSAPLTVTGNVQQAGNGSGGTTTLQLDGATTGNLISGNILNSADGTPMALAVSKLGSGTWTLSGTNSYSGNTTVSNGTLALVGGSHNSAITVNNGATLGFTLGSPTTSSKEVTLNAGHKIAVTGTPDGTSDYLLMTALSITGTPVLNPPVPGYSLEVQDTGTKLVLVADPPSTTLVIDLGAGTVIEGGAFIGSGPTNLPIPALPVGSILRSVSVNAAITATDNQNFANELAILFDPTPGTPGGDFSLRMTSGTITFGATNQLTWSSGAGGPPTTLVDTKTAAAWTGTVGQIDLATYGIFLGNAYQDGGWVSPQGGTWSGTITLTYDLVGAGSSYSTWASTNGAGPNLNDDHDGDGVDNGTEYFIGGPNGNTTGFTPLPGVANNAGTLSLTWTKAADYTGTYGTDYTVETSATLAGPWTPETLGGNVTITGNDVKYTFPGGPPYSGKNFARLKVTGP